MLGVSSNQTGSLFQEVFTNCLIMANLVLQHIPTGRTGNVTFNQQPVSKNNTARGSLVDCATCGSLRPVLFGHFSQVTGQVADLGLK